MSPTHTNFEQYERWHKRDCVRCGRNGSFAARWPGGHVCRTCHDRRCGNTAAVPAAAPTGAARPAPGDGAAVCPDCAGFSMSYACSRCRRQRQGKGTPAPLRPKWCRNPVAKSVWPV